MAGFFRSLFGGEGHKAGRSVGGGWRTTNDPATVTQAKDALVLLGHTEDRGEHPYGVEVVGESHYQDALWRAIGSRDPVNNRRHFVQAVLWPEPTNPYDKNAVRVFLVTSRGGFEHVGYLPREKAATYRDDFRALKKRGYETGACDACIVGGFRSENGSTVNLGVWLNLGWPGKVIPQDD